MKGHCKPILTKIHARQRTNDYTVGFKEYVQTEQKELSAVVIIGDASDRGMTYTLNRV